MHIRYTILCWGIVLCAPNTTAQDYFNRDSLWQVFEKSKPDTNRVTLFIQLGQQYENNNPDSALLLYEAALKLSEELNYTRGVISYYTNATYVYNLLGRPDTSLLLNLKAIDIARAWGNRERLAACLSNTGSSYINLKSYEKAVDYLLQASKILEALGEQNKLGQVYSNLAAIYRETGRYEKAREYGEQSLVIARKTNNVIIVTTSLINLSTVYVSLNQTTQAIELLEEVRRLAKKSSNDYAFLVASLNLNSSYVRLGDFDRGKAYLEEAITLATKLDDRESIAIALQGLAWYYLNKGQAKEAESYALSSLKQALTYDVKESISNAYSVLAKISILKEDFKQHIVYSFKSDSVQNILLNEGITKNIQELETKYQFEKKEQQIKDLQQESEIKDLFISQNRLLISTLIGSLLAVVVIAYLARRTFQQKKKILEKENTLSQSRIAELEKEKQLLASEAVIKGQDEERGRLAKDLHDGLGGLLSGVKFSLTNMKSNVVLDSDSALVFERSLDMLDHSIGELRRVANNMMPEVLVKFGLSEALKSYCESIRESKIYKIDFQSIGVEGRLSSNAEIFIYRIIQELLNNSSKHANATQVLVQLVRHYDELNVTVEDNGIGMDLTKVKKGAGLKNIQSRVDYLKGKLDIHSSPDQGTSAHITIPIV